MALIGVLIGWLINWVIEWPTGCKYIKQEAYCNKTLKKNWKVADCKSSMNLDKHGDSSRLSLYCCLNTWKARRCFRTFYFVWKFRWSMSQNKLTTDPSCSTKVNQCSRPFYSWLRRHQSRRCGYNVVHHYWQLASHIDEYDVSDQYCKFDCTRSIDSTGPTNRSLTDHISHAQYLPLTHVQHSLYSGTKMRWTVSYITTITSLPKVIWEQGRVAAAVPGAGWHKGLRIRNVCIVFAKDTCVRKRAVF